MSYTKLMERYDNMIPFEAFRTSNKQTKRRRKRQKQKKRKKPKTIKKSQLPDPLHLPTGMIVGINKSLWKVNSTHRWIKI